MTDYLVIFNLSYNYFHNNFTLHVINYGKLTNLFDETRTKNKIIPDIIFLKKILQ